MPAFVQFFLMIGSILAECLQMYSYLMPYPLKVAYHG